MKNQKGFIPIIYIVIGAVVVVSATFGIVKYKDEITANVLNTFKKPIKIEAPNIDSTEQSEIQSETQEETELIKELTQPEDSFAEEGSEQNNDQQLQGKLRIVEQKRLEAERKLAEEKRKQEERERLEAEQKQQEAERQRELQQAKQDLAEVEDLIKEQFYRSHYECEQDMKDIIIVQLYLSSENSEIVNLINHNIENVCDKIDQARRFLLSELSDLERIDDLDRFNYKFEEFLTNLKREKKEIEEVIENETRRLSQALSRLLEKQREEEEALRQKEAALRQKLQELEEVNQQILDITAQREAEIEKAKDRVASMATINREIDNINEKYRPILRDLYLQRQQIIDWLNYHR